MTHLQCLPFVTILLTALIVVQCENPACRLLISRDGIFNTSLRGSNERFVCKLAPGCLGANPTIIGPLWKFKQQWLTSSRCYLKNATNTLTIAKISEPDFGTYECWVRINNLKFKAAVELAERVGNTGDVSVRKDPEATTHRPK